MSKFLGILFFSIWFIGLNAQDPLFTVEVDAKKILSTSYLTVEYKLENAKGSNFQVEKSKDFTITGGPSRSTSTQIINGVVSQSMSVIYELIPNRSGNLKVPTATIYVQGKPYKTEAVNIQVLEGKNTKNSSGQTGEQAYIQIELSDSIAYVGQQILLDYKLYTKIDIRRQRYLEDPVYNGFFAEEIRLRRSPTSREIVNGEEYFVKILERVALFPQQTGNYTIGPIPFQLRTPTGKSTGGFFSTVQTRAFRVTADAVNIIVKDFDTQPPSSYSGAIGRYTMQVKHQVNSITQDDAFTMRMTIRGDGDARTVNAPILDFGEDLDVYEPNIIKEESQSNGSKIISEKVFEYIVVPKKTGRFKINPEFSFFNVDSSRFETVRWPTINLAVAPGTGISKIKEDTKISKVELDGFSENFKLKNQSKPFGNTPFLLGLLGLFFPALGFILYKKKQQLDEAAIDPNTRKSNQASSVAEKRLAKADAFIQSGSIKEAFAEISNSLKEYLSDKYQIDYSDLNNESILNLLESKGINQDSISQTKSNLEIFEMALYAGAQAGDVNQVRSQIKDLIVAVENL